jgi:hypothetical protein
MDYQRIYGPTFIDFGNYNYGVVAAAAGYTEREALIAAGAYNFTGNGDKSGIYFNSPRNMQLIEAGFDDYKSGWIKTGKD